MLSAESGVLTGLLRSAAGGDEDARNQLLELVYPDLRRIARSYFRTENSGHTLEPTALVHEAMVRLLHGAEITFADRVHFYATAARQMRRVLVEYGRRRQVRRAVLNDLRRSTACAGHVSPLQLAFMLDRLSEIDSRAAEVVDLRYWGGLDQFEIARVLGISVATVQRDWDFARLWLAAEHSR
jgi:RNA polymerase sigma factor (TIGR02999 family)